MKTMDEIYNELQNEKHNKELNKEFKKLDNELRKLNEKKKKQNIMLVTICIIVDIFIIIFLKKFLLVNYVIPLPALLLAIVWGDGIILGMGTGMPLINSSRYEQLEFERKYKNIVLKRFINNFYDNLQYYPDEPMPEHIYRNNGYEFFDDYNSNDYLEAQINNKYNIQMAEVETTREEEYTNSDGEKETRTVAIFDGLFAKIVIDKSINSELRIMQDKSFKYDKNRLNMDSSEFEKYFDVKASDSIIAMQLLTADVMEELVKFEKKTNMEYDVYIKNNEIYLRFHSGTLSVHMNELKDGILDKNVIHKYFYTLNFTYNLANKLINTINDTQI